MAILLSLLAAAFSGTGDFLGGLGSRYGRVLAVVAASHVAGFITAILVSLLLPGNPIGTDFGWGALAGIAGALAVLALYTGFTKSQVAVVSPVAAVGAAATGVLFATVMGEPPAGMQVAGVVLGMVSIYLISRSPIDRNETTVTGLGYGALAGLGFGSMLVFLSLVSQDSGIWPLVPARGAGFVLLYLIAWRTGAVLLPHRVSLAPVVGAGAATIFGNGAFILAAQRGSLAIVAVVASMFPATTVLLARLFFKERISPPRLVGLAGALVAVGLIATG
ncbi:MAG TPA: DMT family transporter [Acidimicrobiia bacterium]|nr:DMT family transporter [Acidimicrobiia bacterium]